MNKNEQSLILALGNPLLTDDGIGVKIMERLQLELENQDLVFQSTTVGGLELIELIRDYKMVIFIDAVRSVDGMPGELQVMTTADFEETLHLSNFHDVGFLTAVKLARIMEIPVTDQLKIISIEIEEDQVFSDTFSDPIRERYEEIYQGVRNIVLNLI